MGGVVKGIGNAFESVGKGVVKGVKKVGSMAEDFYDSEIGRAITYAALAATAVYGGGALLGAIGAAGTGSVATGLSSIGGVMSTGTAAGVAGAMGASMGSSSAMEEKASKEASRAEARAKEEAQMAARESEILRKQALLASEKSMTARKATAASISNRLKNTSNSILGDEEEKLGG